MWPKAASDVELQVIVMMLISIGYLYIPKVKHLIQYVNMLLYCNWRPTRSAVQCSACQTAAQCLPPAAVQQRTSSPRDAQYGTNMGRIGRSSASHYVLAGVAHLWNRLVTANTSKVTVRGTVRLYKCKSRHLQTLGVKFLKQILCEITEFRKSLLLSI